MSTEQLSSAIDDYISARQQAKPDKWPSKGDWLEDAAKRAWQITWVTHAPKYTHGDSKSSGILVEVKRDHHYLSTSSIQECAVDFIGNSATLDVANLLLLESDGTRLMDCIRRGDDQPLTVHSRDAEQLRRWMDGLSKALENNGIVSHPLAKQTYFPLEESKYHLLSPLFASSLCHGLHQRIDQARFGEEAKEARDARRKGDFAKAAIVDFPQLAEQHFGGTKPQNVSLLNSKRYGRAYLLSCQPYRWQSRLTAPDSEAQFWQRYGYQTRAITRELTTFLKSVEHKDNSDPIKQRRAELVAELVAELHNYAAQLRSLPAGWSRAVAEPMSDAFCVWLDPTNVQTPPDDWTNQIGLAFGRWLNKQLQKHFEHIGDDELHVWRRQLARELRLLVLDLEGWV